MLGPIIKNYIFREFDTTLVVTVNHCRIHLLTKYTMLHDLHVYLKKPSTHPHLHLRWFSPLQKEHHQIPLLCALLVIQATCKDEQVLIHLPQYLRLVNLVECHPEFGWLLHPVLQDIPKCGIIVEYAEGCLYGDHWLQ